MMHYDIPGKFTGIIKNSCDAMTCKVVYAAVADPGVVQANPLNETNANILTILFLVKKGILKQQQQSDNVSQSLSEPPLTKSWICPCAGKLSDGFAV